MTSHPMAADCPADGNDAVWMIPPDQRSLVEIHAVGGPGAGRVWPLGMGVHDMGSAPGNAIEIPAAGLPEHGVQVKIGPAGQAWLMLPDSSSQQSGAGEQGPAAPLSVIRFPSGRQIPRCASGEVPWPADCELAVGEVVLQITGISVPDAAVTRLPDGQVTDYSRIPRVGAPPIRPSQYRLPDPPALPARVAVPVPMVVLILLFITLAWLTHSIFFVLFALFSSALAVMNWLVQRRKARRAFYRDLKTFRDRRTAAYAAVREAIAYERTVWCDTLMDPARTGLTALGPGRRLWERRRGDPDHLVLRVGTVDQPSMIEIQEPAPTLRSVRWNVPGVPYGLDLAACGVVGLAGAAAVTRAVAGWMAVQVAVLHSPLDLRVYLLAGGPAQPAWDWLRWLPHAQRIDEHSGLAGLPDRDPLGGDPVAELVSIIRARAGESASALWREPDIVVIVDGARPFLDATGLARILAQGVARRVFSICLDEREELLPGECTAVVRCRQAGLTLCQPGLPDVAGIRPDLVTPAWCDRVARSLTALRDVTPG